MNWSAATVTLSSSPVRGAPPKMGTEGVEEVGHSYRKAAAGIVVIGGSLAALGAGLTYGLRPRPKVLLDRTERC